MAIDSDVQAWLEKLQADIEELKKDLHPSNSFIVDSPPADPAPEAPEAQ